jgi:hypothetical protein
MYVQHHNFPFVLYGCKNWSLRLREEHGIMVFDNMVLSRIFVPKKPDVSGKGKS